MNKRLVFAVTILIAAAMAVLAADAVTGKWTMTQEFNGNSFTTNFDLKADGTKLTGTVTLPGMDAQPSSTPVSNGKADGNNVSFETKMEFNGNTRITKYEGTLSGDELKLKVTRETQNGPQTNEVTAKRSGT